MSSLDKTINSGVQYLYQLWDENAAAAGGIVFIPSLLVGAAHFSSQVVYSGTSPCYWLFVDVLILCYTIAVVTPCLDIAADLYCFIARVHGDSVPLIVGLDNAVPYPKSFNQRIFWAMVFRVIGSTFALLLLTSATAMTLVPITGIVSNNSTTTGMTLPIQCTTLSEPSYHLSLFFGFSVVAVVFAGLRFGFVHQSKKNGHDEHGHHHDRPRHDHKHNDDYHHELAHVSTPKSDDKKVGEARKEPEKDVLSPPKEAEGKPSEEKEAEDKEGDKEESSGEGSEDSEDKRKKRRERRRRRRERREKRKRDDGSDEDDDDD